MNRLNAYYGSVQHFFKSVFNNSVNKEGFILDRVKQMEGQKALALVEKIFRHLHTEEERMAKVYFEFPDILMVSYKKYLFDISKREGCKTNSYSTINSYVETRGIRYHITSDGNYSDPIRCFSRSPGQAMDKVAKCFHWTMNLKIKSPCYRTRALI